MLYRVYVEVVIDSESATGAEVEIEAHLDLMEYDDEKGETWKITRVEEET